MKMTTLMRVDGCFDGKQKNILRSATNPLCLLPPADPSAQVY